MRMSSCKLIVLFAFVSTMSFIYFYKYIANNESDTVIDLHDFQLQDQKWGGKAMSNLYMYTEVQKERLRHLKRYCKRNREQHGIGKLIVFSRNNLNFNTKGTAKGSMFVSQKKRAIYCAVPKTASTNWKRVFLALEGAMNVSDLKKKADVHLQPGLISLNMITPSKRYRMLTRFYKFLFVRHPFERIVSAYRNKFAGNNVYFERTYGSRILQHTRRNLSKKEYAQGKGTTFAEFVRWVTEKRPVDPHWLPAHQLCKPCTIPYTFIGNMETLLSDADQVLSHLGEKNVKFPATLTDGYNTSSNKLMHDFFSKMSNETITNLYKYYRDDFEAFGYTIPKGIL